jgi:hypothetical protein
MNEKHLIIIHADARGSWRFEFQGKLSRWQKFLIRMVGWEIRKSS